MKEKGYCLVFEGRVRPGFDRRDVIERVARRIGRNPENISRLFRDRPVRVRQGLDRKKALDQQKIFLRMGVACYVEPPDEPAVQDPSGSPHGRDESQCPKCGNDMTKFGTPLDECPYCGVVFVKYLKIQKIL